MSIKKIMKNILSDEQVIRLGYFKRFKKRLNIKDPQTFSEKIQWIKLYGNLERFTKLVDKYEVRNYIAKSIGDEYLIKLYGVYEDAKDINFDSLPNRFVIKATNGCGNNFICKDKSKINIDEIRTILQKWIAEDYYSITKEKQYKGCNNKLIIEEYLEDENGKLNDYKFFCLGGKVRVIEVDMNRGEDITRDFYDCDWNKLDLKKGVKNSSIIVDKPEKLKEMIKLAEKLASDIQLLRVDFYFVDGRIYFGELTFTPANGFTAFQPAEYDLRLAGYVDLNQYNKGGVYEC